MKCFECEKETDNGGMILLYKDREEFFCNKCANEVFEK